MIYIILFVLFFVAMLGYFRLADHYNIIDSPNLRSSHQSITIRGAGVIYVLAALVALVLHGAYWLPILGLFIIGGISFLDDRIALSKNVRLFSHLLAVTALFVSLNIFGLFAWWLIAIGYIVAIGIINAYNFMDGINGITGLYSLVVLLGLQYVNLYQISFIEPDLIWLPIMATLVFLYFNFRKTAKCFAGDVGSITLAFWIVWLLLSLILKTNNLSYILFLAVYGVDSILTIIHRLWLKQNIFMAHRLHFYQILANDKQWPHLSVATAYAVIQGLIIALILFTNWSLAILALLCLLPLVVIYIVLKPRLMKTN